MKYRITKQYSLDSRGRPEINYMVERKPGLFKTWEGVRMFVTELGAENHVKELKSQHSR